MVLATESARFGGPFLFLKNKNVAVYHKEVMRSNIQRRRSDSEPPPFPSEFSYAEFPKILRIPGQFSDCIAPRRVRDWQRVVGKSRR